MPELTPKISVIISTYNAEAWLEKVLWGYTQQTFKAFEVVIADDGSGPDTKSLINRLTPLMPFSITHVWQPDAGFQKTKILNKALLQCQSDYVVMSDGDCIPRADFLAVHFHHRQKGYFLSGGYFKLPMVLSKAIDRKSIETQDCFYLPWLRKRGLGFSIKNLKLSAQGIWARLLNRITPTTPSWNGHNASGWKADILAVNGFDERMQYGGEDRELGERLFNYGIRSKQIRYSAICVHLDHARGYVNAEAIAKNKAIRQITAQGVIRTPYGIEKEN